MTKGFRKPLHSTGLFIQAVVRCCMLYTCWDTCLCLGLWAKAVWVTACVRDAYHLGARPVCVARIADLLLSPKMHFP